MREKEITQTRDTLLHDDFNLHANFLQLTILTLDTEFFDSELESSTYL